MEAIGSGMNQDGTTATHPIINSCKDTDSALGNFDAITYYKGLGVLKAYINIMGDETFTLAMKEYFDRYKWGNTVLSDLLNIFEEKIGEKKSNWTNVDTFMKDYLMTSGFNNIEIKPWTKSDNKLSISQVSINSESNILRYHYLKIAFFDKNAKIIGVKDVY